MLLRGIGGCAWIAAAVVHGAKRLVEPSLGRSALLGIRVGTFFSSRRISFFGGSFFFGTTGFR